VLWDQVYEKILPPNEEIKNIQIVNYWATFIIIHVIAGSNGSIIKLKIYRVL
jgi:hypothetical protein